MKNWCKEFKIEEYVQIHTAGQIFNLELRPPKQEGICDKCGSELIRRKDDTEETIRKRLRTYQEETNPLVEYYEKQGKLEKELVSQKANRLGKDVAKHIIEELDKEGK